MRDAFVLLFFLVIVVLVVLALFWGFLVPEEKAVRALETQGFSDVKITRRRWILPSLQGCADSCFLSD